MKKFVVIYHVPAAAAEAQMANVAPEQQAEGMKAWMNWAGRVGEKLKDMGAPLMNGTTIHHDGTTQNSTKDVSGYSVIEAENMEEAKKLLEGHPHLNGWTSEATIELHETMPIPGM